jgi:DNA-binding PadR family transcriptional regulator
VKRPTASAAAKLPLTPLSLAVLLVLADEPRHGYAIIKALEAETEGRIVPGAGTLYAALQRMVDDGLITERSRSLADGDDQRRRYYSLTAFGRDVARAELLRLARLMSSGSARRLVPDLRLSIPEALR